ncbi:MAG: metallophosphatase [Niastella sp. SCN 39-18]|nr:metallophosphoesterase [Sphingobacteriales bacterium]ODT51609.1 MAG: metallophosphatase [Niastella sp. SCN 39-18]OJW08330.1 MAG: metallophosphatase [Sphingobacteriales bacterium 39-19]
MRTPAGVAIIILIMLALDFYVFQAVRTISQNATSKTRFILFSIYWGISILSVLGFLFFVFTDSPFLGKRFRTYLFASITGIVFAKMIAIIFFIADDIRRAIQWIASKIFLSRQEGEIFQATPIARSAFLSWMGMAAGTVLFGSLLQGFSNKYNYHVRKVKLHFPNLPKNFRGLKIVQISDIHSGSFTNKKEVEHGVSLVMEQQADLILFTGDLVNDRAEEMDEYKEVFNKIQAPLGVFSTLGNHDYGDYVSWPIKGMTKAENLELVKKAHADMGWRLLMNEHIAIEKNGESFALIGIENWSAKARFPKHGRLDLAYPGAEKYPFKILMSHDPSHWDAEVRPQYSDIDLTLSGHTHGMQFGVEIPGFKWSPIQYVYKQWAGLYESENQKLYVNRGFGFIGYPGRVGIMPEITVFELV